MNAGSGNDAICAGAGNDPINDGPGADNAFGEAGKDTLVQGATADAGDRLRRRGGSGHLQLRRPHHPRHRAPQRHRRRRRDRRRRPDP
ncbi:MAG: hypothetical protein ACRD0U_00400, partial [Acidimicrobiales bacterium]